MQYADVKQRTQNLNSNLIFFIASRVSNHWFKFTFWKTDWGREGKENIGVAGPGARRQRWRERSGLGWVGNVLTGDGDGGGDGANGDGDGGDDEGGVLRAQRRTCNYFTLIDNLFESF